MPLLNSTTKEEIKEEIKRIDEYLEENDKDYKTRLWTGWLISGGIHLIIILILGSIVYSMNKETYEAPSTKVAYLAPPPKQEDKTFTKDNFDNKQEIKIDKEDAKDEKTIISDLDPSIKEASSDDDLATDNPKGRETAISESEVGGDAFFMTTGTNGGAAGLFGDRLGGGDKRGKFVKKVGKHARDTMEGIESALLWLKRHQSANGAWESQNYYMNCKENPKGEPGKAGPGYNEAMTGYAVLCFLGYGYDHKTANKYRNVVKKGIEYLISCQKPDGSFGGNYENAIVGMALVEAYGMTQDIELKEPAQKCIDVILARQTVNPNASDKAYARLGWDYINPNPSRQDSSVIGWNCMTLKSALASNLDTKNGINGAKAWLEGAWKAANPDWKNLDPYKSSIFPYTWDALTNKIDKDHLSFVGGCAAVFLGHQSGDTMLESLSNDTDKRWLDTGAWKNNMYCLYYASLFQFQIGGKKWDKWMNAYVPYLNSTQYTDKDGTCLSGTWKFEKQSFHGGDTSQVLLHCYALLAQEVVVRYKQVHQKAKK